MNILDKQSPNSHPTPTNTNTNNANNSNNNNNQNSGSNGGSGGGAGAVVPPTQVVSCSSAGPPSTGSLTSSANDCLIPNSQLIPTAVSTATGPSSVSSSSAPHTPLDSLNTTVNNNVNACQSDPSMPSNGLCTANTRPNVSTPSSVFNNSAPNTPMPCSSVGSDVANITSPALTNPLADYGSAAPVSQSPFANQTNSANNTNLLPSPLSVHQPPPPPPPPPICNDIVINKTKPISNGAGGNKKHCNNRNQNANQNNGNNNFVNQMNMNQNNCATGLTSVCNVGGGPNVGVSDNKSQINYSMTSPHNNMPCMQNGLPINGSISSFDTDCKMTFPNEFAPILPDGCSSRPRTANCSAGMNMPPIQPTSNMMNAGPNKLCNINMVQHGPPPPPPNMKTSQMDGQFMQQHQNQVFVFSTILANQAAEAVDQGQFPSIIHYHMNNPQTKKFIEKNSIKLQNFNRTNNVLMGNIRQTRIRGPSSNGMPIRSNFNNPCFSPYNHNPPGPGPGDGSPGQWNPNWSGNNQFSPNDIKMNCGNNGIRQCGPQFQYNNNFNPQGYPMVCNDAIHDENLTPQQKQHREDKLAILANLQQKLIQQDLMEPNNRLPVNAQSQPNDFVPMDPMANSNQILYSDPMVIKQENEQMNQPPMNPSDINFSSNFCSNQMMNNHPNNDQWLKSSGPNFPLEEAKPFTNGRRKGSQNANHQSPISQSSVNSPNSCINQSPNNRVPPPPYNQGLRTMSSPHPSSPAALSLPSPRMPTTTDTRQPNYPASSVRSGPSTPSADASCGGPPLINSPKSSSSRTTNTNSSPGNKKSKQAPIDNDLNIFSKSEHPLMPVPSPQQIDYINAFEGQELTIQKQPNAHFQEGNELMGNNDLSTLNNETFSNEFGNLCPSVNNPMPMEMNQNNPRFPITSQACNFDSRYSDNMRFNNNSNNTTMDSYRPSLMCGGTQFNQNDSMRFPNCDMKQRMSVPNDHGHFPSNNSMCDMNFNNSIPPINNSSFSNGSGHGFNDQTDNTIGSTHLQSLQKMAPPFDIVPNSKSMGPNMISTNNQIMGPGAKGPRMPGNYDQAPFGSGPMGNMPACSDINESNSYGTSPHIAQSNMPINYPNNFSNSSQMPSNMIPSSNDPQYGMHSNNSFSPMMMNANSHPMIDQNSSNGPNSMPMMPPSGSQGNFPPRLPPNVNRPMNSSNTHGPRYNSPNIQVKPDAPNTIQYLPSRPTGPTTTLPNRPPNLDFLQPSLNMNSNKPSVQPPNTYYPPNNPNMPSNRPNMNFGPRGPIMRSNQNMNSTSPATDSLCQGNDMFPRPPGNISNGPNQMPPPNANFGNAPPQPGNGPIPPPPNKSTTGGPVLHPDSFNFNNKSFNSLPSTSDPNYAAQFHSFQQKLYAINTTRNANNPRMSSNF